MSPKPLQKREPGPEEGPDGKIEDEIRHLMGLEPARLMALQTFALMRMADACERIADGVDDYLAGDPDDEAVPGAGD